MKLTPEQIDHLYVFTRQHFVEWYDLQTELVDHLANAIEQQGVENPKISFEEALQIEFKKFGIFGFMDVVENRQQALHKRYHKMVWQHFKGFFTIPKIFGTLAFFGILTQSMLNFQHAYLIILSLFILVSIVFWIGVFKMSKKNQKETKISGRKWLLKDIIFRLGSFSGFTFLPFQFALHLEQGIQSAVIISFLITCYLLLGYIVLVIIPSKAEEYLKETYPEYNFQNQ